MLSKLSYMSVDTSDSEDEMKDEPILSYRDYYKNNIILTKYKIPELKEIAKTNNLRISGTKKVLVERIREHFEKSKKCVCIQKCFRGYILRLSFSLRGESYRDYSMCVNETDFYTMEPLETIPREYFYTFKSVDNKFTYGCNVLSMIHLFNNRPPARNPYNRDKIPIETIKKVVTLYHLIHLLYDRIEDDCFHIDTESMIKKHATYLERSSTVVNRPMMTANSSIIQAVMIHIESIRSKNISTRIHDLFIDIDLLGNYTNSRWFSNLARQDYIVLYRVMYEIWYYRGGLSRDMRHRICVLEDPFSHMRNMRIDITSLSRQQLQEFCLHIFEYLVYCGIDDGHRNIGTLHALTALTYVSEGARNAMPWLYESIFT